jgi:phosphatidylglycerol---prolipoprotein diacylglyceryl transferase
VLGAISYDPLVRIDLGPLSISPHGVGIAVGFLLGARLMLPAARKKGISDDTVYALLTRAAIGSIIGARLAYVINHLDTYDNLLDALAIWKGGISLLGGFIGAIVAALPAMRRYRLSFWKVMDAAAPGMALGVIIGRVGDLIVGDHFGKATDFFLGYRCPPPSVDTASPCPSGVVVFHTALYDLLLTLVLLGALLWLRRTRRYDGFLIMVFGLAYGVMRIVEDFTREDVRRLGLTGSQWTAAVTALVCLYALVFVRRTPRFFDWEEPEPDVDGPPVTEGAEVGENGQPVEPTAADD